MDNIQYRINKIAEYFGEMQVTEVEENVKVIYVKVYFPEKWIIDDSVEEKYDVKVINGRDLGEYLFCAELKVGFEKVFDAIDHCVGVNKDAMERTQIFQEKIQKLKEIFADGTRTIAQLKTLDFVFPPQKKLATPKKKTITINPEKQIEKDEAGRE